MKITLLLKGNISRRREFENDLLQLKSRFPTADITVLESTYPGHTRALAEASCGHCDYMVAVGGDGTVNEVINGCIDAGTHEAELPCFGVLAHGTANDMLRSLRLQGSMEELCKLIYSGQERRIDIGRVHCRDTDDEEVNRHFVNMADLGIGAEVVQNLNKNQGVLGSSLHYLRAVLRTFASYHNRELQITSDSDLQWQGKTLAVVAANGRYFGSGLCVAPGAALNDGQLFITLIGNVSVGDFVLNLRRLKREIPLEHPEASYHHASRLDIRAVGDKAPLEVDGEFLGYTPATIEVLAARLRFLGVPCSSHTTV